MNPLQEDALIITAHRSGDPEAFGQLYEKYVSTLFQFLYQRTLNRGVAEDLTSDVFFKALNRIHSFNGDKSSFKTWLFTIARNTLIDHYRTQHPHQDITDAWDVPSNENVEAKIEKKIEFESLKRELNKLSPEVREILMMRFWNQLSFKEIAEITKKSEASLKMCVSRAVKASNRVRCY
ncbi:RNA polymerase sigma factor [Candidatus Peregrinibacteria bacterium]|nr:MAG: RNA polymerase sigma factor [Candidatus Peregrinibacteria bacterium]